MEDINRTIDSLKEMLSTDEGKKTLNSLMSSFGGGDAPSDDAEYEPTEQNYSPANVNGGLTDALSSLSRYGDIFASVQNSGNAPRMQLLSALKPYLSSRRQQKFGTIMNLMRYSDVPGVLMDKMRNK